MRFIAYLRSIFTSDPLYVRIRPDQLYIRNVANGREYRDRPCVALDDSDTVVATGQAAIQEFSRNDKIRLVNGFDHPRSIINEFKNAELALQHGVRSIYGDTVFSPSPIIVMHPLDRLDGGLTEVEHRALTELATGAGAWKAFVWTGRELADQEIQSDVLAGGKTREFP